MAFSVIFLAIKPTPVTGIVPKAKKYVFFPIETKKFPKSVIFSQSSKLDST